MKNRINLRLIPTVNCIILGTSWSDFKNSNPGLNILITDIAITNFGYNSL